MLKTGECLNRCNYPWMSLIAKLTIKKKKKNTLPVYFFSVVYMFIVVLEQCCVFS